MTQAERRLFDELIREVEATFSRHTGVNVPVSKWSTLDIERFRDDLEDKVRSKVSEKWVYLHFKNNAQTLPRIDVLNLLSEYVGESSWNAFVARNEKTRGGKKKLLWPSIIILSAILGMALYYSTMKPEPHIVYLELTDSYTGQPVSISISEMTIRNGEADSITPGFLRLKFIDSAVIDIHGRRYYKPGIITVTLESKDTVKARLEPDDRAFMLNYFTNSDPSQWMQKAIQLDTMIHDEAKIYHYHPRYDGIELLNKQEFIGRLTIPTQSLKEMQILDLQYRKGKIYRLRFQTEE